MSETAGSIPDPAPSGATLNQDLWRALKALVGEHGYLEGADIARRTGWGDYRVDSTRLLRPESTAQVAAILSLCNGAGQPVVVHGGRTGLVAGCNARTHDIVLSTERMQEIGTPNIADRTLVVGAGAVLQTVQETAMAHGMQFAVDLGARGSARIGGLIATNAGGNGVIRYGMIRSNVLGLEAVLADGTVVSSMNRMLKNNAGYDLKQLFIGSEGTLGIVTRAILRLHPAPADVQCALVAVDDFGALSALLTLALSEVGDGLSAFEAMWQSFYRRCVGAAARTPLAPGHAYYALIECEGSNEQRNSARFHSFLEIAMEKGLVRDAVIAQSRQHRSDLWAIRDNIDALYTTGPLVTFDVSLPLEFTEDYVNMVLGRLEGTGCDAPVCVFGHLGDGNIHLSVPMREEDPAIYRAILDAVYEPLAGVGGSISGEHGIGLEKKPYLHLSRSEAEIRLMKRLKQALDPQCILNPGVVI